MTTSQALSEVYFAAFKVLPIKEQKDFLAKVLKIRKLREDLIDVAIAESRKTESSRPLREYLKERN